MTPSYHTEVTIDYGDLHEMITWCSHNCHGEWGYSVLDEAGEKPGVYSFKFESEKDYITFLVWRQ